MLLIHAYKGAKFACRNFKVKRTYFNIKRSIKLLMTHNIGIKRIVSLYTSAKFAPKHSRTKVNLSGTCTYILK